MTKETPKPEIVTAAATAADRIRSAAAEYNLAVKDAETFGIKTRAEIVTGYLSLTGVSITVDL